ncbi:phospholipase D-like domain-containing protein [Muribacter muris]|nr:phospholipase D-like domain-containing protein [Muribacter muris]
MTSPVITISKLTCEGQASQDWFYYKDNTISDEPYRQPVESTIRYLINGEEAFGTLYEQLSKAEKSIDIAIWGFQPSMFFKRDGNSICIGDLLIQKAQKGVQVKVLVWSMWFNLQTFKEANLGNMPELYRWQKKGEDGVTSEQREYDYWWYQAIKGEINIQEQSYLAKLDYRKKLPYQFQQLYLFSRSPARLNLQFKKRNVEKTTNAYPKESNLPFWNQFVLWATPTHHQKSVLIDYEIPEKAVGFILEHNMLDNYWDNNNHLVERNDKGQILTQPANIGRNVPIPLQDISSLVTGKILWDINHNFCQSWDRSATTINLPDLWDRQAQRAYDEKLAPKRPMAREAFPPRKEYGKLLMAQVLRTYDNPQEEDIRRMYLQNITKVTQFIYTENQYFRWPELVRRYKTHWETLKENNRDIAQPIYWFAITNSSDLGLGDGTYNTNEMLKLLGRQDVMPGVATHLDQTQAEEAKQTYRKYDQFQKEMETYESQLEKLERKTLSNSKEYENIKTKMAELEQKKREALQQDYEQIKQLKKDIADTVGIKAHICTLVAQGDWQEVYIHSKVTIMDDVFTFLGSANLNTRSMQVDTELGVITECKATSSQLRQALWGLHTGDDYKANPKNIDIKEIKEVFDKWGIMMDKNRDAKNSQRLPLHALYEFLRLTTTISKAD